MATGMQVLKIYQRLDINVAIQKTLNDTKENALDFQAQQMFEGKKSTGRNISPQYSPITVEIKKSKNQVSDRVTLNDTGEFYKSLYFVVKPRSFEFKSDNWKRKELTIKYGDEIFGLNKQFRKLYIDEVLRKYFLKNIKKQIGN